MAEAAEAKNGCDCHEIATSMTLRPTRVPVCRLVYEALAVGIHNQSSIRQRPLTAHFSVLRNCHVDTWATACRSHDHGSPIPVEKLVLQECPVHAISQGCMQQSKTYLLCLIENVHHLAAALAHHLHGRQLQYRTDCYTTMARNISTLMNISQAPV